MRADDLIYGCHSAIQKAIRRGDLDLAYTAFNTLWSETKHRNWLRWRMTVLVVEEAWYLSGELAKFYKSVSKDDEKGWKKFIYLLTMVPKAKDAGVLRYAEKDVDHTEAKEMRYWMEYPIDEAADSLFQQMKDEHFGKLTQYELKGASVLRARAKMGGMYDDRVACIAAMVLIGTRRMRKPKVEKVIDETTRQRLKIFNRKPRTVELGWYCFDMHTVVGKMALSISIKKNKNYGLAKNDLSNVWFCLESAKVTKNLLQVARLTEKPSFLDNMWWPLYVKNTLSIGGQGAKATKELWDSKIRGEVEELVNWCLEKREGDER